MKKIVKLRICDYLLAILSVLILASGIQLEGWWLGMTFIWLHLAVGIAFMGLIVWHLELHFGWSNWWWKFFSGRSVVNRWLFVTGLLTLITAVWATARMFITWHHSSIGGWHGKIGFAMMALVIIHASMRYRFFLKKK